MNVRFNRSQQIRSRRTKGQQRHSAFGTHLLAAFQQRLGFTLVELLVVIAIIGILVALLLPAIQAAREAGRRSQCLNNLRQIAVSCINYEGTHKTFPYGGWSFGWMGDPDQGVGPKQPGGWIYSSSPYLEEDAVTLIGGDLPWAEKKKALAQQMAHVVPTYICPSRRSAAGQPAFASDGRPCDGAKYPKNSDLPPTVAKTDYAINRGPNSPPTSTGGGLPEAYCLQSEENDFGSQAAAYPNCVWHTDLNSWLNKFRGISAFRMAARMGQITDGTSKTVLVGEKSMVTQFYDGECERLDDANPSKGNGGDNSSMYQGYDHDNSRHGKPVLDPDTDIEVPDYHSRFGSPHSGGANIAFCDGSVQTIKYDVDEKLWGTYVDRADGKTEWDKDPDDP